MNKLLVILFIIKLYAQINVCSKLVIRHQKNLSGLFSFNTVSFAPTLFALSRLCQVNQFYTFEKYMENL